MPILLFEGFRKKNNFCPVDQTSLSDLYLKTFTLIFFQQFIRKKRARFRTISKLF